MVGHPRSDFGGLPFFIMREELSLNGWNDLRCRFSSTDLLGHGSLEWFSGERSAGSHAGAGICPDAGLRCAYGPSLAKTFARPPRSSFERSHPAITQRVTTTGHFIDGNHCDRHRQLGTEPLVIGAPIWNFFFAIVATGHAYADHPFAGIMATIWDWCSAFDGRFRRGTAVSWIVNQN